MRYIIEIEILKNEISMLRRIIVKQRKRMIMYRIITLILAIIFIATSIGVGIFASR